MLNAGDEIVASLAELSTARSSSPPTRPARPWRNTRRRQAGVFVRDDRITLATGGGKSVHLPPGDVPVIGRQKDPATVANVLAAVAAGWALGLTRK